MRYRLAASLILATSLAGAVFPPNGECQVLIRRHDFLTLTDTGIHTVIPIGDVGDPAVQGDGRDGFHDYALLDDEQGRVLIYDGRENSPPIVISVTCPATPVGYGGFGASGDGGKNVIGTSDVPDFVIGGPNCNLHAQSGHLQGAIYIVDGDSLAVTEWTLPDDERNLWFGRTVHLLRDYSDNPPDGRVELFVGSDSFLPSSDPSTQGGDGIGYVIDTAQSLPFSTLLPPVTLGSPGRFSSTMDYISDTFREKNFTENEFGRDDLSQGIRFDDFVIGDGYFTAGFPPNEIGHAGLAGFYMGISTNEWRLMQDIPGATTLGTQGAQEIGNIVAVLGDGDNLRGPDDQAPSLMHWSWDGAFAQSNDLLEIQPSGAPGTQTFQPSLTVVPGSGEQFFPAWLPIPNSNTSVSQVTGLSDINLDGHDDFALVVRVSSSPEQHSVRLYSGAPPPPGQQPVVLWELTSIDNSPLIGTKGPKRTSVRRLGDVNGDGSDDWGVVSGIDNNGDGIADRSIALIYGTNFFPVSPPTPLPPGTPRIAGHRLTEIGRDTFIHVTNGIPQQTGVVHRASSLLPVPLDICGGQLEVDDVEIPFTFDANGEAFVFDPLAYDSTAIGTKRYYQVQTDPFGIYQCRLSSVWQVRLEDATNPDEL